MTPLGGIGDQGVRLPAGPQPRVSAGSRLSEAVLGLRSVRHTRHRHVDSAWFRDAMHWSRTDGDLLTSLCAAPASIPEFLLDRLTTTHSWTDELCQLLTLDDTTIHHHLHHAYHGHIPHPITTAFRQPRTALATIIEQFNGYLTTILNPMWLHVSMALSNEADHLTHTLPAPPATPHSHTTTLIPTVFASTPETFHTPHHTLITHPISHSTPILNHTATPRVPVSTLLGQPRATILYALDTPMTIRELQHVTGQRPGNLRHHLHILCRTNLLATHHTTNTPPTYQRSPIAEQLIHNTPTPPPPPPPPNRHNGR